MPGRLRLVPRSLRPLRAGEYTAVIPQRVRHYPPSALERWRSIRAAWEASKHQDWSVWEEFEPLARSDRFAFAERKNAGLQHFFGEALVAQELEAQGFTTSFTGRLLPQRAFKGVYGEQTKVLEEMLREAGLPVPQTYRERLNFRPRNPDLTCFHPQLGWHFIEVKVNGDRLREEQLQTLAFLHTLLPANVEVLRLVPEGTRVKRLGWECSYSISAPP